MMSSLSRFRNDEIETSGAARPRLKPAQRKNETNPKIWYWNCSGEFISPNGGAKPPSLQTDPLPKIFGTF